MFKFSKFCLLIVFIFSFTGNVYVSANQTSKINALSEISKIRKNKNKMRLKSFLKKTYKKDKLKRVLRRTRITTRRLEMHEKNKKKQEYIPIPRKISNRPDRLGREDSFEDQIKNFIVPKELIEKILNKDNLSKGTFVSKLEGNPTHKFYSKTFEKHGIKQLIGVGSSNFAWSSQGRRKNIKATIKKFDNLIIPQGTTFSFNEVLQSVLPKDGFVYEKVILNGKDQYQLGGGVCQVSTTVYRAAFNAGLTINKRRNHSFKVPYYRPQGFDATIYLGGQDLQFINDTPGDIMMQFYTEGNKLFVLLYGTPDRRTDTTSHGGWGNAYWWKRIIAKDGETKEEIWKSYYRERPKEEVVTQ